jgi:hypothetical protein
MIIRSGWNYHVLPGFIVRENKTKLEVKNPDNDQWDDQSGNLELWHMISHNGVNVSEIEALQAYEHFKKRIQERSKKNNESKTIDEEIVDNEN